MDIDFKPAFKVEDTDALIIIDPQNDFCPPVKGWGGALAVPGGDEIMEMICDISTMFKNVVVTQDWHPQNQISFASNHEGGEAFGMAKVAYGDQVLWPDHCVQNTYGSEFHTGILDAVSRAQAIIRKGTNANVDSYSAFFENDGVTDTGLSAYLKAKGIKRVVFVGLAYDFCVGFSALDAITKCGFESAVIIKDATRAIDLNGSIESIEEQFANVGVHVINSGLLV